MTTVPKRVLTDDLFRADDYLWKMTSELLNMAKRDLMEETQTRIQTLHQLRQWIHSQPHIVKCRMDANFLLRFLRSKKFKVELAQEMLDKYLTMRTLYSKWYHKLDILDPAVENLINKGFVFVLPERDQNGRRVIFGIGSAVNSVKPKDNDTMRAMVLTFETLLEDEENQIRGFTYIFDGRGVGLSALSIWSPTEFQKAFSTSERAFPMRHKEVHFVHLPFIISAGFELFKSFLSEKLRNRLMAHSDIESLSQFVPQRILPKEYGGETPVKDMIDLWKQELVHKRERVLLLDQMEVDLHQKKSVTKKPKGMHHFIKGYFSGSFSRLEMN